MTEIEQLKKEVKELRYIIDQIVRPDSYEFERPIVGGTSGLKIGQSNIQKIGFYGNNPIMQPSIGVGSADHTGAGGTTVTTSMLFDGGIPGTGYGIGDIVTNLKNLGLLKT